MRGEGVAGSKSSLSRLCYLATHLAGDTPSVRVAILPRAVKDHSAVSEISLH